MYDITILIGFYKVAWETGSNFAPPIWHFDRQHRPSLWSATLPFFVLSRSPKRSLDIASGSFSVSFSERLFLFSQPVKTEWGQYSTELFTEKAVDIIQTHDPSKPLFLYLPFQAVHSANFIQPLQAPPSLIKKFSHIEDENRRIFAAMVSSLDQGVGKVRKYDMDANFTLCTGASSPIFFRGEGSCTCDKGLKRIVSSRKQ